MKHQQAATHATSEVAPKKKPVRSLAEGDGQRDPNHSATDKGRYEMIRQTAYSFYEARGCVDGHELDDWLQAQAQVNQMSGQNTQV